MQRPRSCGGRPSRSGFNPHPAFWPDATRVTVCLGCIRVAVFQSSSGQKAGCNLRTDGMIVSISFSRFQSSSGQKAGCNNLESHHRVARFVGFNPHPARRPDATSITPMGVAPSTEFSILIRPEGRMQRDEYFGLVQDLQSFNPHPARRPDATSVVVTPVTRTVDWFQSSSGQKAGCNASRCSFSSSVSSMFQSSSGQKAGCNDERSAMLFPRSRGFNPHPARRPDATTPPART